AQLDWRAKKEWGFASSLLIGMVFAAGWTPCVGPALTSILTLSAVRSTALQGAGLLAVYSFGVGLPFLLAAVLVDRVGAWLTRAQRYLPLIHKAAGVLLLVMGIVVLTDSLAAIGLWLEQHGIGWNLGL
ncbi:MAG TPA: cytochrome c biogenesis protein CcdA, partial [Anaerolineae bacterium]|nr:cytochrome c biogenesis protein CcdA [Anaerolineae bacterium]